MNGHDRRGRLRLVPNLRFDDGLDLVFRDHIDPGVLTEGFEDRVRPFSKLKLEEHPRAGTVAPPLEVNKRVRGELFHLIYVRFLMVLICIDRVSQILIDAVPRRAPCRPTGRL